MTDKPTCSEPSIEVPAPKDADGRNVPLDTKKLYDNEGVSYEVCGLMYRHVTATCEADWTVELVTAWNNVCKVSLDSMYLEKPDSIKQLAEDLNRAWDVGNAQEKGCGYMSCYYDKDRGAHCNDCRLNSHGKMSCLDAMMADIVSRVNLLAGDSE